MDETIKAVPPRGVFISSPVDRRLSPQQLLVKNAILSRIQADGIQPQEFGKSGLSKDKQWTANTSIEIMRQCQGAIVLAFARTQALVDGHAVLFPTEYNHYEGGLALGLGLPTLIFAEKGVVGRGITYPGIGFRIIEIPEHPDLSWPTSEPFLTSYNDWREAVMQRSTRFYSCMISYNQKDTEFCARLVSPLQQAGLNVWWAGKDMHGGKKIHDQVEQAIRTNEKIIVVLSEHSIESPWVIEELCLALGRGIEEERTVLFPIRLVDFEALKKLDYFDHDLNMNVGKEVREYHIPDFSNWQDDDAFKQALGALVGDLRKE